MPSSRATLSAIALSLAGISVQAAHASETRPAYIPAGDIADAPAGFIEMCQRDRALCLAGHPEPKSATSPAAVSRLGPTAALGTSERAARFSAVRPDGTSSRLEGDLIRSVNLAVNRSIRQVDDMTSSGHAERWERPVGGRLGDCEDIAIEKRVQLIEAGYDPSKLFFAVVYKRHFGLHTVLIARTSQGDVVLDSLVSQVRPWNQVEYSWLRVQSAEEPVVWRRIGQPAHAQGALASNSAGVAAAALR